MNSSYVVITGASSGIGWEFAKLFAKNKYNLVLIARTKTKLEELKQEIQKNFNVQVVVIVEDLKSSKAAQNIYNEIKKKNLQVEILVNNAGFGDFGLFHELSIENAINMVQVNITALMELTFLFLQDFIKINTGKILNVASTAAFQPGPLMAVYYATKAFVLNFTEALSEEYKHSDLHFTALCPGPTTSGFQRVASIEQSKLVHGRNLPSAAEVAEFGYKALMSKNVVAVHGVLNKVGVFLIRLTPRYIVRMMVKKIMEIVKK